MRNKLDRRSILIAAGTTASSALVQPALALGLIPASTQRPIRPAQDVFWSQVIAAVVGGWLVEALRNYGLVPGGEFGAQSGVQNAHAKAVDEYSSSGYDITNVYQGDYSDGDCEFSYALRSDYEFLAFGTTDHRSGDDRRICNRLYRKEDVLAMHGITSALRYYGKSTSEIEACAFPMHGMRPGSYGWTGHDDWPEFMTPKGTMSWCAASDGPDEQRVSARIRSDDFNGDVKARREKSHWTFSIDES